MGRLDSWQEIADYLGREVRTVQFWEKSADLPIHREWDDDLWVYADAAELDTWRQQHSKQVGQLNSWNEIAAYLRREAATVQLWEKRSGLPVHRVKRAKQIWICADVAELDTWKKEHPKQLARRRAKPMEIIERGQRRSDSFRLRVFQEIRKGGSTDDKCRTPKPTQMTGRSSQVKPGV